MNNKYIYFFPELCYYLNKYWTEHVVIRLTNIYISEISDYEPKVKNSFLNMIFNHNYPFDDYVYEFQRIDLSELPKPLRERIRSSHLAKNIYIYETKSESCTENSECVTMFPPDDRTIVLLDSVLRYRKGLDPDLSRIQYEELETEFQKLLYEYLDFHYNKNYSILDSRLSLNNNKSILKENVLEKAFEIYLINECFRYLTDVVDISIPPY